MANGWKMLVDDGMGHTKLVQNPDFVPHLGERVAMGYQPSPKVLAIGYDYEQKVIAIQVGL
jgi:hypothetical protein